MKLRCWDAFSCCFSLVELSLGWLGMRRVASWGITGIFQAGAYISLYVRALAVESIILMLTVIQVAPPMGMSWCSCGERGWCQYMGDPILDHPEREGTGGSGMILLMGSFEIYKHSKNLPHSSTRNDESAIQIIPSHIPTSHPPPSPAPSH